MKSVLLSIKPKYCALIANGKKTIEVRKTVPKLKPPFKCYIYCTKNGAFMVQSKANPALSKNHINKYGGKVIGEFVCDEITRVDFQPYYNGGYYSIQDRKFTQEELLSLSCLSYKDLYRYVGEKYAFGWHISKLVIYDEPKELNEFFSIDKKMQKECQFRFRYHVNPELCNCANLLAGFACSKTVQTEFCRPYEIEKCECFKSLTRPPQSWCYVEELQ